MARVPFARWKPLPQNAGASAITPRTVIFHTMVGTLAGVDAYFRSGRSAGIESHFGVACAKCVTDGVADEDGEIWQWMDTGRHADANYHANGFAISVETCDHYRGGTYTNPALSPGQTRSWTRLGIWAHQEHGIALRRCPAWDAGGYGYHSMFGAPSDWTPAAGKTCPNPTRIRQFNETVLPAIIRGDEGDWFDMATEADLKQAIREVLNEEGISDTPKGGSVASKLKDIQGGVDRIEPAVNQISTKLGQLPPPTPV